MSNADEAFWAQIEGDANRTVLCEPGRFDEIQAVIDERGYDHITLRASPCCPPGQLLIIDDGAVEAGFRQAVQRAGRSLYD
ncbi:hypothetical protein [Streptomyces sp. NPDC050416]|uniref:hypothetical protein n=1 Tax=Streptomyces sp. NPDC050416 TaxID=3365611 RepID=UPI00378E89B7